MDFTNPVTSTTYRLRVSGDRWRITKVYREADAPVLRHLRGVIGPGVPTNEIVDALVAGQHHDGDVTADPTLCFVEVVLSDMNRTYVILTSIAGEARTICQAGRPGFGPNTWLLRKQRDDALHRATGACKAMADAWIKAGLTVAEPPDWLAAAMADEAMTAPKI